MLQKIAKFDVIATATAEALSVIVQQDDQVENLFSVHIAGGLTSGGADSFVCDKLEVALAFAAGEVRIALAQEA